MNLNWKVKSRALSLFDLLGRDALYFTQKYISRRAVIRLPEIPNAWTFHQRTIAEFGAKRLIEFGAGKSLGQNLYLSQSGLTQHLVDLNPMLDLSLVNDVIRILSEQHGLGDLPAVKSLADLEADYAIKYQAPVDMTATAFEDGSFDVCISTNTLEHIPPVTLEGILKELRRILASGGIISAQIDYSDHYAHTDQSISHMNYLRFSDSEWARHNHRFFYQNRLRHDHYRAIFAAAGFEILRAEPIQPSKVVPADLRPELLTGDDSDYCLTGLWVLRNP